MTRRRRLGLLLAAVAVVALAVFVILGLVAGRAAGSMNPVRGRSIEVSPPARALHERLDVVDLHADSLLWARNLLNRSDRGHVDVPRLLEGNVALQGFTAVTKVPRGQNVTRNTGDSDVIGWLAFAQRWPPATWRGVRERALHQARKLARAASADGRLRLIRTREDLAELLHDRRDGNRSVGGFLGLEGAQVLEGELAGVDVLYEAGYRMMGLAHFFDNEVAGSAHGEARGGLTELGRAVIRELESRGMVVDLAHASEATIDDVVTMARRPVLVSHTGVRATCDNRRNLTDRQLQAIATTGGVIGIGYWPTAVCGDDAHAIARAVRHVADLVGVDHVGLGSDFDGSVETPFDVAGMAQITQALMDAGFVEAEIRGIVGGNALRVLAEVLPSREPPTSGDGRAR